MLFSLLEALPPPLEQALAHLRAQVVQLDAVVVA